MRRTTFLWMILEDETDLNMLVGSKVKRVDFKHACIYLFIFYLCTKFERTDLNFHVGGMGDLLCWKTRSELHLGFHPRRVKIPCFERVGCHLKREQERERPHKAVSASGGC